MSEQRNIFIGECGHPRPLDASGRVGSCACEHPTTSRRPDYLAVEELGRSRHLIGEVITLAHDAPGLTDEQLRHRLSQLADRYPVVG